MLCVTNILCGMGAIFSSFGIVAVVGNTIEVLVDPDNPRRYAVETAFLPKMV